MKKDQIKEKSLAEKNFSSFVMDDSDFRDLGLNDVAYIRSHTIDNKTAYVLHSADGSAIGVEASEYSAVKDAHYQDLNLVALH